MAKCSHCNTENYFYWTLQTNEEGWTCGECGRKPGEPEGFSPQIDRECIVPVFAVIFHPAHDRGDDRVLVERAALGALLGNSANKVFALLTVTDVDKLAVVQLVQDRFDLGHKVYGTQRCEQH